MSSIVLGTAVVTHIDKSLLASSKSPRGHRDVMHIIIEA